jgi:phosphoglycolate phosphatase-like HAD superfamily hydrolase
VGEPAYRPRLLVDFDGVIHRYSRGWWDGSAYDEPMPGALETLADLEAVGYEIVVFSTRHQVVIDRKSVV